MTPQETSELQPARDGFTVPLTGIPADAVLDECDCCHELLGLSNLIWTGKQMLCAKCAN
jgi:hypothetical protein